MALLDRFRGKQEEFELIEGKALPPNANPQSIKQLEVDESKTRVDLRWLENIYLRDPDVYSAVNHKVNTFMSSGWSIKAKDKKVEEKFTQFLKETRWSIILENIVKDGGVFGNAWVEIVRDTDKQIVGFDNLDPKTMDFGRTEGGAILYDKTLNPQYYVQVLPQGAQAPENKNGRVVSYTMGRISDTSGYAIKLKTDEIAHFPMNTVGDNPDGVGWIEPAYNAVVAKMRIEKDWAIAMKKAASPLLIGKVGDDKHRPGEQSLEKMLGTLKDVESSSVAALPYWNDIKYEMANIQALEPNLSYYVDKISAASGVPKPYITGSGDNTPRSTFKGLNLGYEREIETLHRHISYLTEVTIFPLLSEQWGFKEVPQFVFEAPSIEYMDAKADRAVAYTNSGLLIPDKGVRDLIRRMENLPPEPEGIERVEKKATAPQEKLDTDEEVAKK